MAHKENAHHCVTSFRQDLFFTSRVTWSKLVKLSKLQLYHL